MKLITSLHLIQIQSIFSLDEGSLTHESAKYRIDISKLLALLELTDQEHGYARTLTQEFLVDLLLELLHQMPVDIRWHLSYRNRPPSSTLTSQVGRTAYRLMLSRSPYKDNFNFTLMGLGW